MGIFKNRRSREAAADESVDCTEFAARVRYAAQFDSGAVDMFGRIDRSIIPDRYLVGEIP